MGTLEDGTWAATKGDLVEYGDVKHQVVFVRGQWAWIVVPTATAAASGQLVAASQLRKWERKVKVGDVVNIPDDPGLVVLGVHKDQLWVEDQEGGTFLVQKTSVLD